MAAMCNTRITKPEIADWLFSVGTEMRAEQAMTVMGAKYAIIIGLLLARRLLMIDYDHLMHVQFRQSE